MDQKVTLIDKKSHQGIEVNASDKIQLSAQNPSVVQLKISSEDIKEYKKEGSNLVVVLKSGELITIMGFFDADNSLVLQDDVNHKLLWVEFSSKGESLSATYAELNDVGPLLYGENDAASPWAWAAVPLTAGGILAWAGHDSGNDSDKAIGETNEGPSAPESVVIGNGDEWITADEIDADGKVDVTIDLPADAVAGDSVIVNGEETVLTADDITAGEIIVKVDAPNEGETLEVDVIIKDKDGNESDSTQAEATVDTTAPSAPDSVIIGNGDEWISADEIDADGKVDVRVNLPLDGVSAGDIVVVNGEETILTDADILAGNIIVKVPMGAAENEEFTATATIKDAAGNESSPAADSAVVDFIILVNDVVNAELSQKTVNPIPLAEYDSQELIDLLQGDSTMAQFNFTIGVDSKDVVIVVDQDNLLAVAEAFSFIVKNETTGEVFVVAKSDSSQGGLIAGTLGLDVLGAVEDGNGLRLDVNDLPPGDYSVEVHGDSSKLADILAGIELETLGQNTVNELLQDTVKGLVKNLLVNQSNDTLLDQISLGTLLDVAENVPALGGLVSAVNLLLGIVVGDDLTTKSVHELLDDLGFLGSALGTAVSGLVSGIDTLLGGVNKLGEFLYDQLVEPLVDDILVNLLLGSTGLGSELDGALSGVNTLLGSLGLSGVLPALDVVLKLVAENILSNPLTLFPDISADVYEVDSKTYHVEGNVTEDADNGTHEDMLGNGGKLTEISFNGTSEVLDQTDAGGTYAEIQGEYGTLKIYEDGRFSYQSNNVEGSVNDVFTYTVTDQNGYSETATLTVNIDGVNETINFSGTDSDDILQGGAGDDILTGGAGADTAIYYLLDNVDATGGNGTDTWTDFEFGADADKIDISALLDGLQTSSNIGKYISVETNADGKAVISIDRDGESDEFSASDLLVLDNISPADLNLTNEQLLNSLLNNNQIVY